MKNSKSFPCPDWVVKEFLRSQTLRACRALFPGQDADLSLIVIDLALLRIELSALGQALPASYLALPEQECLASFGFAKRQLEWLGGRIAAKHAAHSLLAKTVGVPPCYPELRIECDATGRPHLRGPAGGAPLPAISISHSHGYAGAMAVMGHSCGLDLQRVTPQVLAVRERFATREEVALLNELPDLTGQSEAALLTLLWSAKESLRKAVHCEPLLGFAEVTLVHLEGDLLAGMIGHFSSRRPAISLPPVFLVSQAPVACAITVQATDQ